MPPSPQKVPPAGTLIAPDVPQRLPQSHGFTFRQATDHQRGITICEMSVLRSIGQSVSLWLPLSYTLEIIHAEKGRTSDGANYIANKK